MKVNVTRTVHKTTTGSVDAVAALRERAATAIERALSRDQRSSAYSGDPKPVDLWEAKLCLEVAALVQRTGRHARRGA